MYSSFISKSSLEVWAFTSIAQFANNFSYYLTGLLDSKNCLGFSTVQTCLDDVNVFCYSVVILIIIFTTMVLIYS